MELFPTNWIKMKHFIYILNVKKKKSHFRFIIIVERRMESLLDWIERRSRVTEREYSSRAYDECANIITIKQQNGPLYPGQSFWKSYLLLYWHNALFSMNFIRQYWKCSKVAMSSNQIKKKRNCFVKKCISWHLRWMRIETRTTHKTMSDAESQLQLDFIRSTSSDTHTHTRALSFFISHSLFLSVISHSHSHTNLKLACKLLVQNNNTHNGEWDKKRGVDGGGGFNVRIAS